LFFLAVLLDSIAGTAMQTKVRCCTCVMVLKWGKPLYLPEAVYASQEPSKLVLGGRTDYNLKI